MHINATETFSNVIKKVSEAFAENNVTAALNENAQTYMVRTEQLEKAKIIAINTVRCHGVRVDASPGRSFSVLTLTVPEGTDTEVAAFKFN